MKRIALSLIVGTALITGYAGQATATSPNTGCPPSYIVWPVGSQNPPYHADSHVDNNGDNSVCAKQIDDRTFQYNGQTYPVYNFIDNTVASNG